MKILTKEIIAAFKKQGYTGDKSTKDIKVILKIFNPTGGQTWYLYEQEDEDIYWAFVNLGDINVQNVARFQCPNYCSFVADLTCLLKETNFSSQCP
jgi:hypothetical protein